MYDAFPDQQQQRFQRHQQQLIDRDLLLLHQQGLLRHPPPPLQQQLQQQPHYETFHHRFPQPVPHFSSPDNKMLLDPRDEIDDADGGCDSR